MDNPNLNEVYLFHLDRAFKNFKKYKNDIFKQNGIDITGDQWVVLKSISEQEGINQRELARKTLKEPASITRILDILEKKGWVVRTVIPNNRRSYELYTTIAGKQLINRLLPLAVEIRGQGQAGMEVKEVVLLKQLLKKVADNFG